MTWLAAGAMTQSWWGGGRGNESWVQVVWDGEYFMEGGGGVTVGGCEGFILSTVSCDCVELLFDVLALFYSVLLFVCFVLFGA